MPSSRPRATRKTRTKPRWYRFSTARRSRGKVGHPPAIVREVRNDPVLYAHANRVLHLETNPGNARALVQKHGDVDVWFNPPPIPMSTEEMDYVFGMPYAVYRTLRTARRVSRPTK